MEPENPKQPLDPALQSADEAIPDQIIAQKIEGQLGLPQKVVEILRSTPIFFEFLGRQFSFLGTATDNTTRSQALLMTIVMECHAQLMKSSVTERWLLFQTDPLEILYYIAVNTNYIPAIELLKSWIKNHALNKSEVDGNECVALYERIQTFLSVYENEKKLPLCRLCLNYLTPDTIRQQALDIVEKTRGLEFENFLVGTHLSANIADKEDEFRAQYGLQNGEAFKANMNRLLGKQLAQWWKLSPEYNNPDLYIQINLNLDSHSIEISNSPLYIKGRYMKFVRNLPQTHWHCPKCRGTKIDKFSGDKCLECSGTGDLFNSSVQDLIAEEVLALSGGTEAFLHGAGREDLDARCLGQGRTFVLEIKSPKIRHLDLETIQKHINRDNLGVIHVDAMDFTTKRDIARTKQDSENSSKVYHALIYLADFLAKDEFDAKLKQSQTITKEKPLHQRTPIRVVHRRADKTRLKRILAIEGKYIDPLHIFMKISAEGGTYIKEFISGDNGRTNPSLAGIFGINMKCAELDVVEIEYNSTNEAPTNEES